MVLSLAPMADITHLGFRRLVNSLGAPHLFYSEMIHSPSLLSGGKFENWYKSTYKDEPLIWQLTSNETDTIKETIPILLENGGIGIDLNMGCSAPHIVATGAGFAWLKKNRKDVELWVKNARFALDSYIEKNGANLQNELPFLSVKLRLPSLEYDELLNFASFLVDSGVERITVHARLQKEKYSKLPHYEYIEKLSRDVSIPIFANGEIKNFADIDRLSKKMPKIAGFMIGREAIKKPWIFAKILNEMSNLKNDASSVDAYIGEKIDLLEVARKFLELLEEHQPEEFRLLRAKRFFSYFCDNFTFSHYIKMRVLNAKKLEEILPTILSYLQEVPENRYTLL